MTRTKASLPTITGKKKRKGKIIRDYPKLEKQDDGKIGFYGHMFTNIVVREGKKTEKVSQGWRLAHYSCDNCLEHNLFCFMKKMPRHNRCGKRRYWGVGCHYCLKAGKTCSFHEVEFVRDEGAQHGFRLERKPRANEAEGNEHTVDGVPDGEDGANDDESSSGNGLEIGNGELANNSTPVGADADSFSHEDGNDGPSRDSLDPANDDDFEASDHEAGDLQEKMEEVLSGDFTLDPDAAIDEIVERSPCLSTMFEFSRRLLRQVKEAKIQNRHLNEQLDEYKATLDEDRAEKTRGIDQMEGIAEDLDAAMNKLKQQISLARQQTRVAEVQEVGKDLEDIQRARHGQNSVVSATTRTSGRTYGRKRSLAEIAKKEQSPA